MEKLKPYKSEMFFVAKEDHGKYNHTWLKDMYRNSIVWGYATLEQAKIAKEQFERSVRYEICGEVHYTEPKYKNLRITQEAYS